MTIEETRSVTTQVRMPFAVHAELKESAKKQNRSLNAEIVSRLISGSPEIEQLKKHHRELDRVNQEMMTTFNEQQELVARNIKNTEAYKQLVFSMLNQVATALSKPDRTAEDERDLLAEILKAVSLLKD